MKILVLAEHDQKNLRAVTKAVITAASQLEKTCDVLVMGGQHSEQVAKQVAGVSGVNQVWLVSDPSYENLLAESVTPLILKIIQSENYDYLLAPATTLGKNILPRVAAKLDVSQISDIVAIESPDTFIRPIYAGNALETVRSEDAIKVMTVRPTAFRFAESQSSLAPISKFEFTPVAQSLTQFVKLDASVTTRPELTAARRIVSGGRGLQSAEHFKLIEELADCLEAGVGASRAAVDAGFVPNDYQVGQTGKVVAPELYLAIGISGAIQHLAGMKDSKVIVAINKDPEAPIFQIATYGLVGDLFTILPELTQCLKQRLAEIK